jgi:hypothetical protein
MPSRWLSLAIVLFWLSVMGWVLFWQAVERFEEYSEAPGYTIDLVDEAQRGAQQIPWKVYHRSLGSEREDIYTATTSVVFDPAEDLFDLRVQMTIWPLARDKQLTNLVRPTAIESTHTVTRGGHLLKTRLHVHFVSKGQEFTGLFQGEVHGDQFDSTLSFNGPEQESKHQLDSMKVNRHGSILNPLHPVNRLPGLTLGRKWQVPFVDPVLDASAQVLFPLQLGHSAPTQLSAHVLPVIQTLHWGDNDVPCLVIEYTLEGNHVARTWVQETSGLVLKQEAIHESDVWVFVREHIKGL